jgi:hypothetical protein
MEVLGGQDDVELAVDLDDVALADWLAMTFTGGPSVMADGSGRLDPAGGAP